MDNRAITRRAFTAIAAAPVVSGFERKIRVAVIGTSHGHAISKFRALLSMPEYEVVGVCRPDPTEPATASVFKDVRWLALEDILEDKSIELVVAESADVERNLEYAQRAVSAGKFVHLDK